MNTGFSPEAISDEFRAARRAQQSSYARQATARQPPWRLGRSLRLTTAVLMAAVAGVFVLLHCYRQLTAVISPGKGPMRSLAEAEEAGRATPCRGAALESNQSPGGASGGIEHTMLEQTEGVVRRLIEVTNGCSSVAILLPDPFPNRVVYLFLGLCIQEVAALSSLLGSQFDAKKAEVLQNAIDRAQYVMRFCQERGSRQQHWQVVRLVHYAGLISSATPDIPQPEAAARLQMLQELVHLQETALGLIQTALSSFLESLESEAKVSVEAMHELIEELRRLVYTRRYQVFIDKHLSHHLRNTENVYPRGVLIHRQNLTKLDGEAKKTLEEQLSELTDGEGWVKKTLEETQSTLSEASLQNARPSGRHREPQLTQTIATKAIEASGTHSGSSIPRFEAPPRFPAIDNSSKKKRGRRQTRDANTSTRRRQRGQHTSNAFSPSENQSSMAAQALEHQTPSIASPPRQPLPELEKALSELSLGSQLPRGSWSSSGPVASSPLTAQPQPTAPATEGTLEASWRRGEARVRFGTAEETSSSPWSSAWPRSPSDSTLPLTSESPSTTTADMEVARAGVSLDASAPLALSPNWSFISSALPPSSSSFFTTPQSISVASTEMLYSLGSQTQPEGMHMATSHSGPTYNAPSLSSASSPTRGKKFQSTGMSSSSEPEGRP